MREAVDGMFGLGTVKATQSILSDIDISLGHGDKSKLLKTIDDAIIKPKDVCQKSSSDDNYLACFSLF